MLGSRLGPVPSLLITRDFHKASQTYCQSGGGGYLQLDIFKIELTSCWFPRIASPSFRWPDDERGGGGEASDEEQLEPGGGRRYGRRIPKGSATERSVPQ